MLHGVLGGHHGHPDAAALAVLAGADLHQVGLPQVAEGHAVLGVGGVGGLDGEGGHAVRVALGDLRHLIQGLALPGGRRGDVVQGHRAGQAPLVVLAVGVVLDLLAGDHLAHVEARLLGQLHGLLARQLVAGVVQGEQQHAVALVRQLHGVKDQLAVGGGEDVAHRLDVQHALAHKTRLGGLVAGAAVGDDGHPVRAGQVLADDQMAVHVQNVGVGQAQSHQLLVGDGFRGVDKLLHFHMQYLSFKQSQLDSEES